jgi:hypothetical protein
MGGYCRYCQTRCFVPFPPGTPLEAINAYRPGVSVIATCPAGQAFERRETGWDYQRIQKALSKAGGPPR